jgi:hypothetical protein
VAASACTCGGPVSVLWGATLPGATCSDGRGAHAVAEIWLTGPSIPSLREGRKKAKACCICSEREEVFVIITLSTCTIARILV